MMGTRVRDDGIKIWMLITAHPDDESMFFIPTLRNIIINSNNSRNNQKSPSNIQLLCLSNGDYRHVSDGPIRTKEMYKACSIIGTTTVTITDDDRMKDGPNEVWNSDLIAEIVLNHICKTVPASIESCGDAVDVKYHLSADKKLQQETKSSPNIQTVNLNLLTFDKGGVSNHPNHIDVFKGVQYLLNEKCHIVHGKLPEKEHATAKLRLYPEGTTSAPSAINNNNFIIDLNVSMYTLRTISNPLRKYFLWVVVDIIPYICIWLFQVFCYLVYFLLGGLLWGSKRSTLQIHQFSRMTAGTRKGSLQCRIMNPILVWRAMSAHHSQFVWYRRLSVMFSRYTYINDLEELPPISLPYDEYDEDDLATLSPVSVIKEQSSPKFLISQLQMNALRGAILPPVLQHRPWKRIYSLSRDGDSFVAFRKLLEEWHGSKGHQSSILVVKTTAGDIIGGYTSAPIVLLESTNGSTAGSCLFKLKEAKNEGDDQQPVIDVYGKKCTTSTKKIVFDATRRRIAFGGGYTDGIDEGFGLCIDDNFTRGTSAKCAAFRNEPLVSNKDGVFSIVDLEVYGFAFGQF